MVGRGVRSQEERAVPGGEPLYQYGSSVGRQQAAPGSYLQCGLFYRPCEKSLELPKFRSAVSMARRG
jgi:hypothetical protein